MTYDKYQCLNGAQCKSQIREKILTTIREDGFNITGVGKETIEALVNQSLIRHGIDLYELTVLEFSRVLSPKSANTLVNKLTQSRELTLSRFLLSLGLSHLTKSTVALIVKQLTHHDLKPTDVLDGYNLVIKLLRNNQLNFIKYKKAYEGLIDPNTVNLVAKYRSLNFKLIW